MELLIKYLLAVVITTSVVDVLALTDYAIFMVANNMSVSSFACKDNSTDCYKVTIDKLRQQFDESKSSLRNELIFQSGIHVWNYPRYSVLGRGVTQSLIINGQINTTIMCATEKSRIDLKAATNVSISSLHFKNCKHIKVNHANDLIVKIMNCKFLSSDITIAAGEKNTLNATIKDFYANTSSLTFGKTRWINIVGHSSSAVSITCVYSPFQIIMAPSGKVKLHNLHLQDCYHITFNWKAKNASVEVVKSFFINSCLKFEPHLTNSGSDTIKIEFRKTVIEWCSCDSVLLFNKPKMNVFVLFNEVNMTDSDSVFLKLSRTESSLSTYAIKIMGRNFFAGNKNFILHAENSKINFVDVELNFSGNIVDKSIIQGAPIYVINSTLEFEDSYVLLHLNQGQLCGGIVAEATQIVFKDNVTMTFSSNKGLNGGALSLYTGSRLTFKASLSNISLFYDNNTAQVGGAIYVEDSGYSSVESIFILECEATRVKLIFGDKNVATFSGNQIYGGWIDWFTNITTSIHKNHIEVVEEFLEFQSQSNEEVSSHPIRICLCVNGKPDCNIINHILEIYGCGLTLEIVGVGQRYTPVVSHVQASLLYGSLSSEAEQSKVEPKVAVIQSACTTVYYKITSQYSRETLTLKPYLLYLYHIIRNSPNLPMVGDWYNLFQQLSIELKINPCPLGFINSINCSCGCLPSILKSNLHCNMRDYTIHRSEKQWVGVTYDHNIANEYPGVIAHQYCPFDYCSADNKSLLIHLENQDEQCAFNRRGILCGECKKNLSRVLGTSNCKKCSNTYTLVIIVSFLISGLLLVIILTVLDLTVSVGTINGLTFYANIIRAQHTTFFTKDASNSFLSKFIAWLNLDQGMELCFYDGLDSHAITGLQYFYPLYIWSIAAALIVLSHYSRRFSKLVSGKNSLQVLATLFLISYTRLLRVMIEVISFTRITYPDGYVKTVWLVNGNVEFFTGRHIPLVLVTIMFVLLSLPYTFTLLTIQFLYKLSHYRVMFWVHRLKPFFDAYTGPYKAHHRYWTGLLLICRIALLITFSVNQSNNISINLLAIITVSVLLLGWLSSANWVYESPLNNFLEIIFLTNLGLTSAVVSFNMYNKESRSTTIYISSGIAFVILFCIILYHIQRRLVLTKFGSNLKIKIVSLRRGTKFDTITDNNIVVNSSESSHSLTGHAEVMSTVIDLNESCQSKFSFNQSSELKEPLLNN